MDAIGEFIYSNSKKFGANKHTDIVAPGYLFRCPYCDYEKSSQFFLYIHDWESAIMEHVKKDHEYIMEFLAE